MAAWFSRSKAPKPAIQEKDRLQLPGGLWTKCLGCAEIIYTREVTRNLMVCPKCEYHFRLPAQQRIEQLSDRHTAEEFNAQFETPDPLKFKDSIRYTDRIKRSRKKSPYREAMVTLRARLRGRPVMLGIFNYAFIGGSMGAVVGDKLLLMIEAACQEQRPVIIVSSSGGARMQEGIYSLMQMAKVTAALVKLSDKRLPYISVLTDPTTGGVAASFAMLGDVIVAEPGALIGFAGPRVIEQTIKRTLPEGFQRSEFLLEHGMVDLVVGRRDLKDRLAELLELLTPVG